MDKENVLVAVRFRVFNTWDYLSEAMIGAYSAALWCAMRTKPFMTAVIWERDLMRYFDYWGTQSGVKMYHPKEPLLLVTFAHFADSFSAASSPIDAMQEEIGQGEVFAKDLPRLWALGMETVAKSEKAQAQIICLYTYELKFPFDDLEANAGAGASGATDGTAALNVANIPYDEIELVGRVDLSRVPVLERTE